MWIWLGSGLFLLFLIIVVLLLSQIKLRLMAKKNNKDDMVLIDVTLLYGLVSLHYNVPTIELNNLRDGLIIKGEQSSNLNERQTANHEQAIHINKQKIKQWTEEFKMMLEATLGLKGWIQSTFRHLRVTRLDWSTYIALSDAAHTATLTGFAWAIKSTLVGFLSYHISLRQRPKLLVVPKFGVSPSFVSELQCTAQIRLGYAIYALFVLIFRVLRENKGLRKWLKLLKRSNREGRDDGDQASRA
ncbi:DUF2953 domain-containing protein [Paenibacillus aceti]|uniref:DUF2953 domain-containing protein n=1 Tax=Paenibacillus aceti TaxID=1820010 RepID=A0ABQ1VYL0_9BACL|nr:DUF2953 domain-containing protein [Paenibacillus aceti]GGG05740.1 hypothetical protein GCM10010913_29440 [Paenibacillus aceti]